MDTIVVLDTNIVIYFLRGRLLDPLPSKTLSVSVISEIELLSHPTIDRAAESTITGFLSEVQIVGLSAEIKDAAIALRRRHSLAIPDAIIAATAIILDTELLSNDAKLNNTPGLRCRRLALLKP